MYANTKAARTARTRQALEGVARALFETRGFAAVSAEQIVAQAGVTRGALYHHYDGKEGLFAAVAEAAMQRLHDDIGQVARTAPDPLAALKLGVQRFLELTATARVQRILFIDAPAVLGWHRWRQTDERYGLGLLKQGLEQAMASGQMRRQSSDLLAHVLLSAMIEAAMLSARSRNKKSTRREAQRVLERLIDGLV